MGSASCWHFRLETFWTCANVSLWALATASIRPLDNVTEGQLRNQVRIVE